MPLTYDQMKERFESLAEKIKNQLEQAGYTDINESAIAIAKPQLMDLQDKILKEVQAEYQVSYQEAFFIASNMTETRSSDDVFSIMKQYNLDEKAMIFISKLEAYYSLSLEDAAKEASLLEDKNKFNNSSDTRYFIKKLMSAPGSQYKSVSEIANTLSKYQSITDTLLSKISSHFTDQITSGKITLSKLLCIFDEYKIDNQTIDTLIKIQYRFSLPLEDAAKEAFLIEDKEKFNNSSGTSYFIAKLMSAPGSQYKSVSEIANTLSKYQSITDKHISELACWRVEDISYGKMTLDEALQNTAKYGIYGSYGCNTGTKPYSFIESVKEFFGFKSSSESIETPAQELKAAELVDNSHHTDSNE